MTCDASDEGAFHGRGMRKAGRTRQGELAVAGVGDAGATEPRTRRNDEKEDDRL